MTTSPQFASVPKASGGTTPATADTSRTAPTNTTTVFTAGASGSKIEQIRLVQILTTTGGGGILTFFLHDGANFYLFEYIKYGNATIDATNAAPPIDMYYANLVIPAGWTVKVANTVASGTGASGATHKIAVFGGDF